MPLSQSEKSRLLELTQMITNESANYNQYYDNISDTFRIFNILLAKHGASKEFENSMQNSLDLYEDSVYLEDVLKSLKTNTSDSFIVVPIMTEGHLFSSVIRKIIENNRDVYSMTVVNAGYRNEHHQYEEYMFEDKDILLTTIYRIESLSDELQDFNLNSLDLVYKLLQEQSSTFHKSKLHSGEQSVGNCFIKEVEKSIKLATNSIEYIKSARFHHSNDQRDIYPVKFVAGEKILSTKDVHCEFIDIVKQENPELTKELSQIQETYLLNKQFRTSVSHGNLDAIEKHLYPTLQNLSQKTVMFLSKEPQLSQQDLYTLMDKNPLYERFVFDFPILVALQKEIQNLTFKTLKEIPKILKLLQHDSNLESKFPLFCRQIRKDIAQKLSHIGHILLTEKPLDATILFEYAFKFDENNIKANLGLGILLQNLGLIEDSLQHLKNYKKIKSDHLIDSTISATLTKYGKELYDNGKWEESLSVFQEAHQVDIFNPLLMEAIGDIYFYKAEYSLAHEYYEKASLFVNNDILHLKESRCIFMQKVHTLLNSFYEGSIDIGSLHMDELKAISSLLQPEKFQPQQFRDANRLYRILIRQDKQNRHIYEQKLSDLMAISKEKKINLRKELPKESSNMILKPRPLKVTKPCDL